MALGSRPATLFCDASLIPDAMNGWLAKGRANGWKKGDFRASGAGDGVVFPWVRGHNGVEHNEISYAGGAAEQRAPLGRKGRDITKLTTIVMSAASVALGQITAHGDVRFRSVSLDPACKTNLASTMGISGGRLIRFSCGSLVRPIEAG